MSLTNHRTFKSYGEEWVIMRACACQFRVVREFTKSPSCGLQCSMVVMFAFPLKCHGIKFEHLGMAVIPQVYIALLTTSDVNHTAAIPS
jgi:hypothetical protein